MKERRWRSSNARSRIATKMFTNKTAYSLSLIGSSVNSEE